MAATPPLAKRKHSKIFNGVRVVKCTYLQAALDEIKRADQSVGDAAGENASHHALPVVREVVSV